MRESRSRRPRPDSGFRRLLTALAGLALCLTLASWVSAQDASDVFPETSAEPAPAEVDDAADGAAAPQKKKELIPTEPIALFLAGGALMWPILLSSIVAIWFALERIIVLRRMRVIPRAFVTRFIQHLEQGKLDAEAALRLCEENGSPVASVFEHGVRKWGKPSVEVEQAIIDGGERQVSGLRAHLRIINGVATVAPLLGLLGTVVGMIQCFNEIANTSALGKAEALAGGIGVALLTTAAGLCVAIPSLILYMYLAGRVDALVMEMDNLAQKVINLISAEALGGRSRPTPKPAAAPASSATAVPPPAPKPKAPVAAKS